MAYSKQRNGATCDSLRAVRPNKSTALLAPHQHTDSQSSVAETRCGSVRAQGEKPSACRELLLPLPRGHQPDIDDVNVRHRSSQEYIRPVWDPRRAGIGQWAAVLFETIRRVRPELRFPARHEQPTLPTGEWGSGAYGADNKRAVLQVKGPAHGPPGVSRHPWNDRLKPVPTIPRQIHS